LSACQRTPCPRFQAQQVPQCVIHHAPAPHSAEQAIPCESARRNQRSAAGLTWQQSTPVRASQRGATTRSTMPLHHAAPETRGQGEPTTQPRRQYTMWPMSQRGATTRSTMPLHHAAPETRGADYATTAAIHHVADHAQASTGNKRCRQTGWHNCAQQGKPTCCCPLGGKANGRGTAPAARRPACDVTRASRTEEEDDDGDPTRSNRLATAALSTCRGLRSSWHTYPMIQRWARVLAAKRAHVERYRETGVLICRTRVPVASNTRYWEG
jgi:hypothetical protein